MSTIANEQLNSIMDSDSPAKAVQEMPLTELYALIDELGAENSIELLLLATPEQQRLILDLSIWLEWSIDTDRFLKWLELILDSGEESALSLLNTIDQELLMILLKKSIVIGGGLSDIINSEDLQGEWDHTFDESFYIRFINDESNDIVLKVIELLYTENNRLYRSVMLGAENELLAELEDAAWQFRVGRLEDEGIRIRY